MNAADIALLNRRARMTPEERSADIAREVFGPMFREIFGVTPEPQEKDEEQAK